jgi:hypothetical protein
MKSIITSFLLLIGIVGCCSTPRPEETATLNVDHVKKLLAQGDFEEVKRLTHQRCQSDPLVHWATRLQAADQMFINGKRDDWMNEYQEFFRFYEEWERRGRENQRGQQQNPELSPAAVAPDEV